MIRAGQDANAAYSQGLDLKTQGNCAAAIVKLRPVANLGPGYENAQTALGACLLDVGAKNRELSSDYLDGLTWLSRAADAGWPEAQGALAAAHTFGPTAIRSGEEAAYWLALYENNTGKSRIGFTPMAQADLNAIVKSLTPAQQAAGAQRAAQWQRKVWLPPQQPSGPGIERGPVGPSGLNGPSGRGQR
jgi:TPR repeat protein